MDHLWHSGTLVVKYSLSYPLDPKEGQGQLGCAAEVGV
jgi:hypothetical protein